MKKLLALLICIIAVCALVCSCGEKKCEHTAVTDSGTPASCTEAGTSDGSHCSECGEVITAQTPIAALGHDYATQLITESCKNEGCTLYTCTREGCGDSYKENIVPMSAHRFNGGDCLGCGMAAPTEELAASTEWYVDTQAAFTLTTKEELAGLAQLVNSGTSFAGKTIFLGNDIDLGYLEWTPIGNESNAFDGVFNGNGYTISSVKIGKDSSFIGLFGNTKGKISDFTIDNASIWVEGIQTNIAIACGYSTADIKNVRVDGYVDAKLSEIVGGVVGYSTAQLISLTSDTDVVGGKNVGGIAGYAKTSSALLKELVSYGDIASRGDGYSGGIIGAVESSGTLYFESNTSYGHVSGSDYTGGLIGSYVSTGSFSMENCTNYATVEGGMYTSGVIGCFQRSSTKDTVSVRSVKNCANINGNGNVGGIFGYYSCTGTSNLTGLDNEGNITGNDQYVGGIAGYSAFTAGELTNFSNGGTVNGATYTGGIIGYIDADIDISNFKNSASIRGISYVGGLIGYVKSNGTPNIAKCENSGSVNANDYVGGLIGRGDFGVLTLSELTNDADITGNSEFIGGIGGYIDSGSSVLTAENIENRGNVTGASHISGGFAYVRGNVGSIIKSTTSSSSLNAEHTIGAIAAEAVNVTISDCSNAGTQISATGCLINGNATYAYVGGYVGNGYEVKKCINAATIDYLYTGSYVGGIAGYLKLSVTECSNSADIKGYDYVGGISGWISSPSAIALGNLTNTGNISGQNYIGGIVGKWEYGNNYVLTACENSGKILGNSYVAGIIGELRRTAGYNFTITELKNTGDVVAGGEGIGGLFGSVYGNSSEKNASVIENCSSSADITGTCIVGGLIGRADNARLKNSSNEGSSVTATGFKYENSINCAYLGGYIGMGGAVEGLTNNADITYDQFGAYVGGIVGYENAHYNIENCTNNGRITSRGDRVGGIVGGYIAGNGKADASWAGLNSIVNNGDVSGNNIVGGIIGYFNIWSDDHYGSHYYSGQTCTDFENTGDIVGVSVVGEIFGNFSSDGRSTLVGCTVLGHVTEGGEIIEDRDVGSNTNLAISGRVIHDEDSENAPEEGSEE